MSAMIRFGEFRSREDLLNWALALQRVEKKENSLKPMGVKELRFESVSFFIEWLTALSDAEYARYGESWIKFGPPSLKSPP